MYIHQAHLFSGTNQLNIVALQLPSDKVWQVAEHGSSLAEAHKVSWDDSMAKISVCRTKMDLINVY